MSTATPIGRVEERGTAIAEVQVEFRTFSGHAHECRVILIPEEEGGFSAHALRLPGCVSQGETEVEALSNISEAFRGVIETHRALGNSIPWRNVEVERISGSKERWI